ncbi:hypothetical protein [Bdellovibrio sp. HCB337]|uniref:hypothetical protein n=1 Tax=Bdellovibrio sp. HCB337 TaxID=3394358 RepID=UPI0039A720EA
MEYVFNFCLIVWPLLVSALAFSFNRKQNSQDPWTGGPISWPKSFWLAYTVSTWFLLPIIFLLHPNLPSGFHAVFIVHLLSWWIRGPLELFMIYKWFNWSPRYGISHDIFHLALCGYFLSQNWSEIQASLGTPIGNLATVFCLIIIFTTCAEILFAALFLRFRSQQEEKELIYFASDDPKWIFINRVTLSVVLVAMSHLILQSLYVLKGLL